MNNFPEEFLKFLDDSQKHLSSDSISQFASSNNNLTESELEFLEDHLSNCKNCRENLNNIFDEKLYKSKTTFEIDVNLSTKNLLNFTDNEKKIDGIISKENNEFYLTFVKLPSYLENANIRISLPGGNLIIRTFLSKLNKKYKIESEEDIDLRNNSKVYIDFSVNKVKSPGSLKNKVYKYWYVFTTVVLVIILYLIIKPGKTNQVQSGEDIKQNHKVIIGSSIAEKESNLKLDTVTAKEKIVKTNRIPSQIKVEPEFRNNSFLENYVNMNKENGIIINPVIGDTLRKQITF